MELFISITTNQRIMIIAIMNIMMYLIAIYYAYRVKINIHVRFIKNLKFILFMFVVINLFRITSSLLNLENTYFVRNWLNSVIIIFGICLHIGLTFAILYIIYGRNQYKFVDLEYKYQKKIAISKSEEKFQQLFEQMPLGIAIHQLLYDDHGKAINYRFLNVNHSYEEHTTLKAKDIIGKTLYEVIPDDAPIWLKKYTNVVKNKSVISFVDYSKPLNSYFNIVVYPIEEDKFVTIVNNITKDIHKDQELEFLVTHDYLTKLKNRQEFLKDLKTYNEIEGISTKLILMDIDGF
ncbi:MAG: PAS domain-containing protein, partial [Acholeplasmataceae bacterium]